MMFWDTIPGAIASWAAAIAGLIYLSKRAWGALQFGRSVTAGVVRLIQIGTTSAWPNGSTDLASSLVEIYNRQGATHDLLENYIVTHRSDHEALELRR
jgi:hypothetical protein